MKSLAWLLIIISFGFGSCQQPVKPEKQPLTQINVGDTFPSMEGQLAPDKFSLDDFYQRYISQELQSYIEKNHPNWSVPNQNLWYPRLFDKYKTSNSLVNCIQADFDCDGRKDYALIVNKGNNMLSAVAFLRLNEGFKTVELTELRNTGEKINYALTLYKPQRYDIEDPDLDNSDARFVNLKCSGVGVGYFKELYDGGDDVYYWQQGKLRSCIIGK